MMHSIGVIETSSIAKGFESADAMVKTASVDLVEACTICPGKFLIVVVGSVADVKAALEAGAECAGSTLVDRMELANVAEEVPEALRGVIAAVDIDAMGIFETFTAASGVLAADAAVKAASVQILELRLARGMAGKSFFTLSGSVSSVKAALEAAKAVVSDQGLLVQSVVIPAPHESLKRLSL